MHPLVPLLLCGGCCFLFKETKPVTLEPVTWAEYNKDKIVENSTVTGLSAMSASVMFVVVYTDSIRLDSSQRVSGSR